MNETYETVLLYIVATSGVMLCAGIVVAALCLIWVFVKDLRDG